MPKASSTFHRARLRRAVDGTERRDRSRPRSSIPTRAPFGSRAQSLRDPSSRYEEALRIPWSRGSRPVMIVVHTGGPSVGRTVASGAMAPRRASCASQGTRAVAGSPATSAGESPSIATTYTRRAAGVARSRIGAGCCAAEAGGRSASGTAIERAGTRIASTAANGRSWRGKSATSRPMARNTVAPPVTTALEMASAWTAATGIA